jgi:metal-responsive CopG/Arc/MetJ family transcriptional regulator
MPSDTVMMTIRLPRDLRDAFLEAARRDDLSASQILRRAIRSYLSEGEGESVSRSTRTAPTPAPVAATHEEPKVSEDGERDVEAELSGFLKGVQKMCGIEKWGE